LNYLIVAYAFILPLTRAGLIAVSILMILFFLLSGDIKEHMKMIWSNQTNKAIILFILFNFISLIWVSDENRLEAFRYMSKYWYLFPIFIIYISLKREYLSKVISAFLLGMLISEIISYGVFFEIWQFKHATPSNPSPFMHHIEYSTFLALTALLLLNRIFNEGNIKFKIFYSIFFITVTGNLFLTNGRTGQLSFMLGLAVLGFMSFKNKLKAFLITLVLLFLIVTSAYQLSDTFKQRVSIGKNDIVKVMDKKDYCSSWGARIGFWVIAGDILEDNPLLGIGESDNMTQFKILVSEKYPEMQCNARYPHYHNQYLQILTATGIIGLLFFLYMFYTIYKIDIRVVRYRNIKIIFLTLYLFGFIAEPLLHAQFSMLLFSLMVGILLAEAKFEQEDRRDHEIRTQ
jgi:O-antigen ligase